MDEWSRLPCAGGANGRRADRKLSSKTGSALRPPAVDYLVRGIDNRFKPVE